MDLAARSPNWALTAEGEKRILDATPAGWAVCVVRAPTSSDGDGPPRPSDESIDAIRDAEAYFGFGIPKALFGHAKRLRWVHSAAAGVGSALYPEMLASDVVISNSAGVHAVPIAEYVVAGILHFYRGLDVAVRQQGLNRWDKTFWVGDESPIREISGARVLVIGAGGIGSESAKRLAALGANCVGVRRNPARGVPPGFTAAIGFDAIDSEIDAADVVLIAAPLTPETRNVLSAERMARLKSGAVVVNVARGALVDEAALIEALRAKRIRGAVLDVFVEEPLAPGSALWKLENVLVTPHISPVSPGRFWPRALDVFVENWGRYTRGERLVNQVDKSAGY